MSNNLPPVRFAICGVGHIGRRHAALVARHAGARLVALIDVRADLQPGLAVEFPGVPCFLSLDEYLARGPAADVLTVATPNGLHAAQAVAGLRHGLHVVVEKPLALTTADAETIVQTAQQTGRLVFGVMQNRYSPPAAWLKQVYDAGRLGDIYLVQLSCFWNRDARYYRPGDWRGTRALDGGTLFTQFSHFVDLLYWVFGDISNISARFRDFNHAGLTEFEDSGLVTFDLVRGGSGTLSYSTAVWDRNLESSLTVVAARGSLRIAGQYLDRVEYCHLADYQLPDLPPTNPANHYGPFQGSAANHVQVIDNVVDTVQQRSFATTNALEGLKVVEIIERIYALRQFQRTFKSIPNTSTAMQVINSDPEILGGTPVFNGTRVPIKNLFDYLETGETIAEFLDDFPSVAREQVLSVLAFSQQILNASTQLLHENPAG